MNTQSSLFSYYYAAPCQAAPPVRKKRYISTLLAGRILKVCYPPNAELSPQRRSCRK